MTQKTCWTITDDKIGNQVQAQGLASAVGFKTRHKTISLNQPWKSLPPGLWLPGVLGVSDISDAITPPWPDLIISCGRQAVGVAAEIKRRVGAKIVAVHIQHPRVATTKFDLIAAPTHDQLLGKNVVSTIGSLGRINRRKLDEAADDFHMRFKDLPRPLIAVSIGGSNSVYDLQETQVSDIASALKNIAHNTGGSLLISTSRRTGVKNDSYLREVLSGIPGEFWDGTSENPYLGYLGSADYVIVTCDSVNMLSEACTTGKPVFIIQLAAKRQTKFDIFHKSLIDLKMARPFDGALADWTYDPLDETARIAAEIHQITDHN